MTSQPNHSSPRLTPTSRPARASRPARDIARSFGILGLTSFGGPTAHLGYFRQEFVSRRGWLSDRDYADLVAVSQFLPGPASSQVGMALGYHHGRWSGMALAWALFTLPSAILLTAFGLLLGTGSITAHTGWLSGLLATAVAVVAHAVFSMARGLLTDATTWLIAVAATAVMLLLPASWTQIVVIALAGLVGIIARPGVIAHRGTTPNSPTDLTESADPGSPAEPADPSTPHGLQHRTIRPVPSRIAVTCLAAFFVLLGGLWLAAETVGGYLLTRANAFYQAGSLVFGGGHVVLPLLEGHVVGEGWLSQSEFIAGYSAAQAVPGPLFTFASYLGAVDGGVAGAVLATVMIFLPAVLLIVAGLHFWARWSHLPWLRAAFAGMNAAVVGILAAALWDPIITHGITDWRTGLIAAACLVALARFNAPAWAIAGGAALAGQLLLG